MNKEELEREAELLAQKEKELLEKQEKVNEILKKIIPEKQMDNYNRLSDSIGVMFGLMFVLEEEKVLEKLGEESTRKIKESLTYLVNYAGKGIEEEIGKDKSEEIRKAIIENNLA